MWQRDVAQGSDWGGTKGEKWAPWVVRKGPARGTPVASTAEVWVQTIAKMLQMHLHSIKEHVNKSKAADRDRSHRGWVLREFSLQRYWIFATATEPRESSSIQIMQTIAPGMAPKIKRHLRLKSVRERKRKWRFNLVTNSHKHCTSRHEASAKGQVQQVCSPMARKLRAMNYKQLNIKQVCTFSLRNTVIQHKACIGDLGVYVGAFVHEVKVGRAE